jgi:hypothetical protein
MPKLRDDLLRHLSPDDQELMKRFRKRPPKAYTLEELLPKNAFMTERLLLELRLEALISQHLVMKIFSDDGQIYYAKAKGRAQSIKAPPSQRQL